MLVPVEALAHIACSACNKYLSYFPIYLNQDSLQPICGRCSEILATSTNYIRDKTYETLAQFIKFPCKYDREGCVEHLTPSGIPDHEKDCPYRLVSCALECVWQGKVTQLVEHIQTEHPCALIQNGEFEIDITHSYETHAFFVHNDEIFALKRKFNDADKTLQCSLSCYKIIESVSKYYYEMTVLNGSRNLSQKFPMKSADDFVPENITEINVTDTKRKLNDPSHIIGYIKIFTLDEHQPKKPKLAFKMDMLSELECPVCFEYIIPPIFQCVTGHSICGECKIKIKKCPTCKRGFNHTQNFTLEKMASLLTYPCKFVEFGCEFAAKPDQMAQHQRHCLHGPQLCPLRDYEYCSWKGSGQKLYAHITADHHDNVLEIDNLCIFFHNGYFTREDNQCYIKKFSNAMFKVHYRYAQDCFYWAVQFIGPQEEVKNYKFEIDIRNNNDDNHNQRLFLRSLCAPLKDARTSFNEPDNYVSFRRQQINSFLTDQLTFTIRVMK